jgi:hypothetical protein
VRAHARCNLEGKAHAIDLRAAVRIIAPIGARRQELVDEVAVRAVDLKEVESAPRGARGGLAPRGDQGAHLGEGERARCRKRRSMRDRARGDQLPLLPIVDPRLATRERRAALPGPRQPRLAPGMAELNAGDRALGLDERGAARKCGDELVVPKAGVADGAAAAARHLGRLHDDEAGAALRIAAGIDQVPIGGEAVDGRILVHGSDDDAVLERHAPQRQRRKKQRLAHSGVDTSRTLRTATIQPNPRARICPATPPTALA